MTQYSVNFNNTFPFSDTVTQFALATNAVLTYTVPGTNDKKYRALMTYNANANVFVGYNVTPVTPTPGTTTTVNNVEFRPNVRYVQGGDILSFITPDTNAYVGLSLLNISS